MSRRLSFLVRRAPATDRLPVRSASFAIVLIVIGTWVGCVGLAYFIAAAVRLTARVFA